ncbi:hypothetical protein HY086_04410 [Candidatus Gottesmanbacteria bacterium]|nr:hypothetical protein [Candidatus Gottesmanbacteria bacterium]
MKTVNEFLHDLCFTFPKYSVTADDKKTIKKIGLAQWITNRLTSGKFRRGKVFENTRVDILNKVTLSLEKQLPIYLIICFGGFKHFWNPSHPTVDWADFFNIRFMAEYVSPILAVYAPGALLEYEAEDYILTIMNNYPAATLGDYAKSFEKLTTFIAKSFPNNFQVHYVRAVSQYNTSLLLNRLPSEVDKKLGAWKEKLLQDEKLFRKVSREIMWKGEKDLTQLSEKERKNYIIRSKAINEIFLQIDYEFREKYFVGENHIPLVLSWGTSESNVDHQLTLASTYTSTVDFWIGRGILEDRGQEFVPRIVSQDQYISIKSKLKVEKSNLLPLKNFETIEIYPGTLNFVV